jgi:magnesium-transporting ATPase (P-type)
LKENLNEVQASQSQQLAHVYTQQQQMCECIRDGEKINVPIEQVVVGDVVVLSANNAPLPADMRLLECAFLMLNRSVLGKLKILILERDTTCLFLRQS